MSTPGLAGSFPLPRSIQVLPSYDASKQTTLIHMPGTRDAETLQRSQQDSQAAPLLSLDVFRLILEHLPRPDLLKLTFASRFVREEATRELLMRPVTLKGPEQLQSFCKFALSGNPAKLSSLRTLVIQCVYGSLDEDDRDMIVAILRRCPNLTDLQLQQCDCLLTEDSRIPEAISSLPSLRKLSVSVWLANGGVDAVLAALRRMVASKKHSPLRSFHFSPILNEDSFPTFLQEVASAHRGLENFSIAFKHFLPPAGVSFPHVHTLRLEYQWILPRLSDLYAAFPNLRVLRISRHISTFPSNDVQPAERVSETLHSQRAMWPSLDTLFTTPNVVHALGLFCPVRTLEIVFYDLKNHYRVAEVVSRLRPRKLSLAFFQVYNLASMTPPAEPRLLLYNSGEAGVKHLSLRMPYNDTRPPETKHILETMRPLLSASRVELLQLTFAGTLRPENPSKIADGPLFRAQLEKSTKPPLQDDLEAAARAMVGMCTALQCIAITITDVSHTVWRIDKMGGRVEVVRLDSYEGKRFLEQEATRCLED
ncbi:hypothetical protein OH77DRAFT_365218 [Trametes cingulata]|nr:hypothetical protein OH77DRAFT_365218 [Trametes cingulata]